MHRRLLLLAVLLAAACGWANQASCPPSCVPKTGWRRVVVDGHTRFVRYRISCGFLKTMSDSSSTDTTALLGDSSSTDTTSRWIVDSVVMFVH